MKNIDNKIINEIKQYGRMLDVIITYKINGEEHLLDSDVLYSVNPHFNSDLLKSVMKELDIESAVEIPKGTLLNVKLGVLVDFSITVAELNKMKVSRLNKLPVNLLSKGLKGFKYIDFGNYIVSKEPEYNADTLSYTHKCYDKMLYSMINYEDMKLTFPITVRDYIKKICDYIGLTFANKNDTFANYNRQITADYYLGYDYTFRDVLDELAQVTASNICINSNDELEIRYISNESVTEIDEDYFKENNVTFEDISYGPINSVVLSRSGESDNVYKQDEDSVEINGLCELKIIDNQIMNYNDRSDYLPDILNKLNGLTYCINDFDSNGICFLDLCDRYTANVHEKKYSCVLFNDDIKITQGLEESIYTERPKVTETDYTKADKTDQRINKAYIVMDKVNKKLESLISETSENSEKLSLHEQTIDSITDTLSSVETKVETVESTANTANTTANSAKSKADSNATEIQTTITKLTEVEETVDGITQTVNETKQSLQDNYSTTEETEAKIQQASNSITTSVNKKITEIQVDADNLLLNTALKKDASNFTLANGVTRVTDKLTPHGNYCFKYNISGLTADAWRSANPSNVDLNAGEIVTASANVYVPSGVTNSNIKIEIQFFKADGTRIKTFTNAVDLTKTNIWQRVSVTGTAPANTVKANARVWIQRNGQCWVGDLKLGRGNTVTSWSPSSKDYPTVKEFGTLVEQNWEHVKVAWNTICEYLQLENLKGNASLVVRDGNKKLIMSLDKTGQHFWTQKNNQDKNIAETTLKDITINNQTKKALMFLLDNAEMNGEGIMAWGYKSGNNVYPVLYVGNFGNEEFGLHLATDLIAHANAIKFQNASIDDDGANLYLRTLGALKLMDTENNTWIAQFFKDEGNYGFSIKADDFTILNSDGQTSILSMYTNENGKKTLNLFDNSFFAENIFTNNFYADNVINTDSISSMSAWTSVLLGEVRGYVTCTLKGGGVFTLEGNSFSSSDERLKENIQETKLNALERIKQLNHVQYDWKLTKEHEEIGYIAQELEKIDKNYVVKIPNPQNDDVKYTVRELSILATATKAIQELNEKVEKQDKLINKLLKKLNIREEDINA